jgi:hypothetical protein
MYPPSIELSNEGEFSVGVFSVSVDDREANPSVLAIYPGQELGCTIYARRYIKNAIVGISGPAGLRLIRRFNDEPLRGDLR